MKKLVLALLAVLVFLIMLSAVITLLLKEGISLKDKVALVIIEGPIIDARDIIDELKGHAKDPAIKAIVLRVDSPGGAVAPSQEIFEEVKKATSNKKVVASMGTIAASGGYYVASPADRILANPGTITGSIGVIMEIPNIEGLMDKVGIKTQVVKSGRNKDMASVFREMKDEERIILQGVIDDVYRQFVEDIAETRDMDVEEVIKLADGRIFTGRQAVELGLVDELGGLEEAISVSAKLAGIKGEPEVVSKEDKLSIRQLLKGMMSGDISEFFPHMKLKYMISP
jgi:protease-4